MPTSPIPKTIRKESTGGAWLGLEKMSSVASEATPLSEIGMQTRRSREGKHKGTPLRSPTSAGAAAASSADDSDGSCGSSPSSSSSSSSSSSGWPPTKRAKTGKNARGKAPARPANTPRRGKSEDEHSEQTSFSLAEESKERKQERSSLQGQYSALQSVFRKRYRMEANSSKASSGGGKKQKQTSPAHAVPFQQRQHALCALWLHLLDWQRRRKAKPAAQLAPVCASSRCDRMEVRAEDLTRHGRLRSELCTVADALLLSTLELTLWSFHLERLAPELIDLTPPKRLSLLYKTAFSVKCRTCPENWGVFLPLLTSHSASFESEYSDWLRSRAQGSTSHVGHGVSLAISPCELVARSERLQCCQHELCSSSEQPDTTASSRDPATTHHSRIDLCLRTHSIILSSLCALVRASVAQAAMRCEIRQANTTQQPFAPAWRTGDYISVAVLRRAPQCLPYLVSSSRSLAGRASSFKYRRSKYNIFNSLNHSHFAWSTPRLRNLPLVRMTWAHDEWED
eukprot:g5559.t1